MYSTLEGILSGGISTTIMFSIEQKSMKCRNKMRGLMILIDWIEAVTHKLTLCIVDFVEYRLVAWSSEP